MHFAKCILQNGVNGNGAASIVGRSGLSAEQAAELLVVNHEEVIWIAIGA